MLGKLLKYDLQYLFKYWWMAAVTSFMLTFVAGGCYWIINENISRYGIFQVAAILGFILVVLGLSAFALFGSIMSYVRYYKNFFTDEGYLTFTLPVTRNQLLLSKVISGLTVTVCTAVVLVLDIINIITLVLMLEGKGIFFLQESFWDGVSDILNELFQWFGGFTYLYVAEGILLCLACALFMLLFVYLCITISSIIAKKKKVLTSIALYYFGGGAVSFGFQMLVFFFFYGLSDWLFDKSLEEILWPIAWLLLIGIAFLGICIVAVHLLLHWLLDRKLNLS